MERENSPLIHADRSTIQLTHSAGQKHTTHARRRPTLVKISALLATVLLAILLPTLSVSGASSEKNGATRPTREPKVLQDNRRFLPIVRSSWSIQETLPAPTPVTGTPPINFAAVRQQLAIQGLGLAYNKIGFHVGPGGNMTGLGDWMASLNSAGVPFFLKSADVAGPLYEAQLLAQSSGLPHTLVFRLTTAGQNDGYDYDVPNYNLPPAEAAAIHWQRHLAKFPPELDPGLVWIETINEVDKNRSEWLAEFGLETAQLALRDGYKWAAFGWSSGEPEPQHWESPAMLDFLSLISRHPDQLAIALHEYSYSTADIGNLYPYLLGRFQVLFDVCDRYHILRPTVLITEWGWESTGVSDPGAAMEDIKWASWLYSAYPQVRGAAIWYLGGGYSGIANDAQKLIAPVSDYSLSSYFAYTPGYGEIDAAIFTPTPNTAQNILLPLTNFRADQGSTTPQPRQADKPAER